MQSFKNNAYFQKINDIGFYVVNNEFTSNFDSVVAS